MPQNANAPIGILQSDSVSTTTLLLNLSVHSTRIYPERLRCTLYAEIRLGAKVAGRMLMKLTPYVGLSTEDEVLECCDVFIISLQR